MRKLIIIFTPLLLLAGGCSGEGRPQVVTGRAQLTTFPTPITSANLVRNGKVVATSALATDGGFSLTVPPGKGFRIEFAAADATAGLVYPRQAGGIDASFAVRNGGAPFDLGMVRYIGAPLAVTYSYSSSAVPVGGPGVAGDGDGECEDGHDASGAVCVDDDGENENDHDDGEMCDVDDGEQDDGDHQCEDGIDPVTGAFCDGGPAANQDDGEEDDDGVLPSSAAVADHNLPASIGCGDEGDEEDDD